MNEQDRQRAVAEVLRSLNALTESALRRELSTEIDLGHSERLQFEVCPTGLGITLIQTEEPIVPDDAIHDAVPPELRDAFDAADESIHEAIEAQLPAWFAERWQAALGPTKHHPAYLFFHGGLEEPRYDLEARRWCKVSEVWPDD